MKLFQELLSIIICLMMLLELFTACGEDKSTASDDKKSGEEATTAVETVAVLETTADGGAIEQDSEGNKIIRDNTGKIIEIKDKEDNPVDITVYLSTHTWIEDPATTGGNSDSSKVDNDSSDNKTQNNDSNGTKDSSSKDSEDSEKTDQNVQPTSADGEGLEESIPVVIATIPDDDDMIELPDL